jgi:glycosyltransferase involved in cell wall biosynthesis
VLAGLGAGGAERVVAQISARLAADGAQVTVIAFDRPGEPVFHVFDPRVRLERLGLPAAKRRWSGALTSIARVRRLRQVLRPGEFDVAVSFLTKVNVLTLAASIGLGLPVIVSERNNPPRQPQHALWRQAVALLYRRAAAIVIQTDRARACLPLRERHRATVIRNPVTAPPVNARGQAGRECVAVGRLTEQKGFDLLIAAFALIAARFPDWRLVIWGEGPDRRHLERQVAACGLSDRVTLPGTSPAPGSWAETATMLVLSSRYEGSPNVLAEAMAAGIPVVATDCDFGPAELIGDERYGLLVPPDYPAALATGMAQLMADRELRDTLGKAGQEGVTALCDTDVIMDEWRQVIRSVMRRPASEMAATLSASD